MGKLSPLIALLATSAAASAAALADTPADITVPAIERPRIGLVLSGGGARGGAHVGVLEVLEELRIPIDCIAGTSMGALVGGGYAAGLPAASLREFLVGIDWRAVVGGVGQHELLSIERKRAGVNYSNQLELGLQAGRVIIPGGLVSTAIAEDLLRAYVARARATTDFDQLPIPFRAVATDMLTGSMVVIGSGDLATAMRASMAIPGVFSPVSTDQHVLADGGLVRNLPVDVARELCADVVIAVTLSEPPPQREQLRTAAQVAARTMDVILAENVRAQLETLGPGDVHIDVPVGDIKAADFERAAETLPLGEAAARRVADQLGALSLSAEQYAAWRTRVTLPQEIEARLAGVRFERLERVNPEFLLARSTLRPGDELSIEKISEDAARMTALGEFESIEYRLEGDPEAPTLVWLPREKSWGPHYLEFDLGLYASTEGTPGFVLSAQHRRTWLNRRGAEWRNRLQIGYESLATTSLYQPLDLHQRYFLEPYAGYTQTWENLYIDSERVATYIFRDLGGGLEFGVNFGRYAQARAGYGYTHRQLDRDTGTLAVPEETERDAGLNFEFTWDTRDSAFSPTRGMAARLEYRHSDESLGAERDWQRAELGLGLALPFREDVIWLMMAGGLDLGTELPFDRAFSIGGPASFPGLEFGELRTARYGTVSGSYLWKITDILRLRGEALYAGVRAQAGWFQDTYSQFDDEEIYGLSFYLVGRTFVGPLTVGAGFTSSEAWGLWLSVGRPIGHGSILDRGVFR